MKFRLKMDLSQFYDDERNLAYILVDPNWDQVICLQQHVQQLFDVPEVQFLTDDGIYIPPRESIDVIKISDVLRAIVPQKSKTKKKKKKSPMCNGFEAEADDESMEIGDKRKCDDEEGLTCSTPNLCPKKKKQKTSKKEENQSSMKELEESRIEALQNSNTVTSTIDSKELEFAHPENISEDTIKSRKRKRSRKNKKSQDELEKDEKKSRLSSVPIPISSSTLRLSKSMSTPNNSTKHVHFSDEDDGLTVIEPKSKEDYVIYRSLLSMDCEARIIEAEEVKDTPRILKKENISQVKKPEIVIHEDIVLVPAPQVKKNLSLQKAPDVPVEHQEDCSVIEVDDSVVSRAEPDEDDDDDATAVNDTCSEINVEKILPLSEELTELPNIGDVILFKLYQLSEAFTPEISQYICGRCEDVDSTQKTLNCLVLDGLDQIDENLQNPDPSDGNRVKSNGKINCFEFCFNDMLDKRVFRM
ncbi:coilin [Eupeodes corollae]|uniref:coilin n=1 Tax=Eupeodes corollae TaxID=290404 RepID=UPI0024920B78|nr:coilin [Eupeodes corollae]